MSHPYTILVNTVDVSQTIAWDWGDETRALYGAPNYGAVEYSIERIPSPHQDQGVWEPFAPSSGMRTITFLVEGRIDAIPTTRPVEACITAWNRCAKDYRPQSVTLKISAYDGPDGTLSHWEAKGRIMRSFPWREVREDGGPETPGIRPHAGRYIYPVVVECPWPFLREFTQTVTTFTWAGSPQLVTVVGDRWAPYRLEVVSVTGSPTSFRFKRDTDGIYTDILKASAIVAGDYLDCYYTDHGLIMHRGLGTPGSIGGLNPVATSFGLTELRVYPGGSGEYYSVVSSGLGVAPATMTTRLYHRGVVDQV